MLIFLNLIIHHCRHSAPGRLSNYLLLEWLVPDVPVNIMVLIILPVKRKEVLIQIKHIMHLFSVL